MNREEIVKEKFKIQNKWFETKEDELDIALNIIDDLLNKNDKAIEYIEKHSNYNITLVQNTLIGTDIDDLLDILKGSEE